MVMKFYSRRNDNNNNNNNRQQLVVPTLAAASAATAFYAAYRFYRQHVQQQQQQQASILSKPLNDDARSAAVSYIHVKVSDLKRSKQFYLDVGLVEVVVEDDESCNRGSEDMILLKVPSGMSSSSSSSQKQQTQQRQPYLLLQHDKERSLRPEGVQHPVDATTAGYGRMCLLVQDVQKEVQRLAKISNNAYYQPVAPPVTDRPGNRDEKNNNHPLVTIVAYRDPDGNMVELVSFSSGVYPFMLKAFQWMGMAQLPLWVHVNINATNYETSWKAYQALGMVLDTDYGKVENSLYQALNIPSPGIAKQVSLIKFPQQAPPFVVDLIQWQNPPTEPMGSSSSNTSMRIAIKVDDVALKLDRLLAPATVTPLSEEDGNDTTRSLSSSSLWTLESTPTCVNLPPPFHRAIACTIADPDGVLVDLVSFPKQSVLLPKHFDYMEDSIMANINSNNNNNNNNKTKKNKNKAILVTGCDSGFGRSIAVQMAGLGFDVIAACYTQDGADFLASIATSTVVADLSTEKGLKDVVGAVHSIVLGDLDIEHGGIGSNSNENAAGGAELWAIVNNAGMAWPGHVEWTAPQAYKRVMDLNFHAPVYLIHEFLPLLRQAKGRIVNVTSVCGIVSSPSNSTYCSSKFALEALSDALRVENKPFGVNVIVVEPMTMDTPLAMSWIKDWDKNFKNADPSKKSVYPSQWAEGYVQRGGAMLKAVAEDPRITVGEIVNALVMMDPPARILSGVGARGYYQLSRRGESVRDAVFHMGPEPTE
jgi:NAD(P)-dependent dehydrogenase (short-subunit alcohol dehydrogenase family)/catechol 2,3-dioxygenase-like lactoylglutathione lyase family enzyme